MKLFTAQRAKSVAGIVGIFLLTGCGLTSCDDDSPGKGFSQTVTGEKGSKSSVRFGADAKIPEDFPTGVPLPEAGPLRAVVAEANPPNATYTLTYVLGGRDGIEIGNRYRDQLQRAGYTIEHYSSVGGTDGAITQFDAIGKRWDVAVVSGKANPRDRSTLSVQVHTHGQVTSGIGGIGDTTPDASTPTTDPATLEVPPTTTTVPAAAGTTTSTTLGL